MTRRLLMLNTLRHLIPDRHPLRLSWHWGKALIAATLYGFPARKLTVIGITGTDGKTTTVGMVAHILHSTGIRVGALSTAYFRIGNSIEWNVTQKTSPSPFELQKFLRKLVKDGCTHAVLEYSSHGLVQGRTFFTWPKVAAITNTSLEHLDYHGSMEQYRKDKGKLFTMLRGNGTKVLNIQDKTFEQYSCIPTQITILYDPNTLRLTHLPSHDNITLYCNVETEALNLHLNIPGAFNRENALCAISCALAIEISMETSLKALQTFEGIRGRMERIDEGQPFTVFIDFTVTPVAYEKTLKAAREILEPEKRLLVLTGSCGDRMKEKRPMIGKICAELADVVVVTNEDPYTEDPDTIIGEVWKGVTSVGAQHCCALAQKIPDRREAMRFLFSQAQPGDIVLLCGKGSDTTMTTKDGKIPWDEREIARELLKRNILHTSQCQIHESVDRVRMCTTSSLKDV